MTARFRARTEARREVEQRADKGIALEVATRIMKHNKNKKLSFSTETIRALRESDLGVVAGGAMTSPLVCRGTVYACASQKPCPLPSQDQIC